MPYLNDCVQFRSCLWDYHQNNAHFMRCLMFIGFLSPFFFNYSTFYALSVHFYRFVRFLCHLSRFLRISLSFVAVRLVFPP